MTAGSVFFQRLIGVGATAFLLVACAHQKEQPDFAGDTYRKALEQAQQTAAVPDFVNQALLNNHQSHARATPQQKRFDVIVNDIPAKTFFLGLVAESGANLVTHPEVEGSLSLNLRNVTLTDVLNVVRDIYGYEYREKDNIYTIFPSKLRTEIFTINYIDIKRVGVADTNVSIGVVKSSGTGGETAGTSSSESANVLSLASNDGGSQGTLLTPGSRIQTLNKTDFWGMLEKTVGSMIGMPEKGRNVMMNPQSGLLAVTAMPNELSSVRQFLERAELSVKRQVVLEAQILEVKLYEGFEAGINWNAIQGQAQYSFDRQRNTISPPTSTTENTARLFTSVLGIADIRDLVSLLETQGSVQVLSSPRVSTVNNQKAIIRVGTDEFFVVGLKNNTTSSAATTMNSPEVELASFFSGISLDVTPQISENGDVILHIHPIVSEVQDQTKELTVGDSRFSLPLALRDIRESDSIVRAQSGQVIVLGGLMQQESRDQKGKRPLLGEIPLVNTLFKTRARRSSKTELVILLRPIVVDDSTWQDQLQQFQNFSNQNPY